MKNLLIYFGLVVAIVAMFGFAYTINAQDEPAGKNIFVAQKCAMCHSVSSVAIDSKKKDASDLSTFADAEEVNAEFLTSYLKKEAKKDDKDHKVPFKGTDEELVQLVDWLLTLKTK